MQNEDSFISLVSANLYLNKYQNRENILMLGWEFPPNKNGGLGVATYGILKEYENQNFSIDFSLPCKMEVMPVKHNFIFANQINNINNLGNYEFFKESVGNINISKLDYYTNYNRNHEFNIPGQNFFKSDHIHLERISQPLEERVEKYSSDLIKFILFRGFNYSLVHAHDWLTAVTALAIKKTFSTPFIFHVHATEVDRSGGIGNRDIFEIEKLAMEESVKIICVSNYTKNLIIKYYNIDENKIDVVHNGINTEIAEVQSVEDERKLEMLEEFASLKDEGYSFVLSLGRLTHQKGLEYLVQAAKTVSQYNRKILFLFVGRGDQEQFLIEETARLGLGHIVFFCGWQDDITVKAMYSISDVFIMPSRSEPFGLVALEASLNNTPLIISKTSGASEVLPASLLVDCWDADKIANFILSIISYPALKHTLIEHGFETAMRLNWEIPCRKLISIYYNLLDNP